MWVPGVRDLRIVREDIQLRTYILPIDAHRSWGAYTWGDPNPCPYARTSVVTVSVSEHPWPHTCQWKLRHCGKHPDPLSTRQYQLRQWEGKTPLTLYMSAASCCVSALAQRECRWRHIPCRRSVLHYITSTFYPVLRPRLALSCPLYCMHDSNNHGLRCSSTLQPQRLRDRTLRWLHRQNPSTSSLSQRIWLSLDSLCLLPMSTLNWGRHKRSFLPPSHDDNMDASVAPEFDALRNDTLRHTIDRICLSR